MSVQEKHFGVVFQKKEKTQIVRNEMDGEPFCSRLGWHYFPV